MKLELQIEREFVEEAKRRGCDARKLREDGRDGFPDRTVITPNGVFFIEFKRNKRAKLRPTQRKAVKRLRELGRVVLVTHDLDEALQELDKWISQENPDT